MSDRLVVGLATIPMVSGVLFVSVLQRGEPVAVAASQGRQETVAPSAAPQHVLQGFPGVVTAGQAAELAGEYAGRVTRVFVDSGETVEQGAPIVQIDQEDVAASVSMAGAEMAQRRSDVQKAAARLSAARSRLGRIEQGAKWLAAQEIDAARAEVRVAEAELRSARALVSMGRAKLDKEQARADKFTIDAPFAGTVVSVDVDPGDTVSPGRVLARIISGERQIKFAMPREVLKSGVPEQVWVSLDDEQEPFAADVLTVRPEVDPAAQMVFATAALPLAETTNAWIVGTNVRVRDPRAPDLHPSSERFADVGSEAAVSP